MSAEPVCISFIEVSWWAKAPFVELPAFPLRCCRRTLQGVMLAGVYLCLCNTLVQWFSIL